MMYYYINSITYDYYIQPYFIIFLKHTLHPLQNFTTQSDERTCQNTLSHVLHTSLFCVGIEQPSLPSHLPHITHVLLTLTALDPLP